MVAEVKQHDKGLKVSCGIPFAQSKHIMARFNPPEKHRQLNGQIKITVKLVQAISPNFRNQKFFILLFCPYTASIKV